MYQKYVMAFGFLALFMSCQKKQDQMLEQYRTEYDHITRKWKVQEAYTNSTGNEVDNADDVTYDWEKWSMQFWPNDAYRIIEYSPDSTTCLIESGVWQIDIQGPMLLKGSESLIDFDSGNIIDEGDTERHWIKKKNENNELWVWIENSFYVSTGVFLKMVPY